MDCIKKIGLALTVVSAYAVDIRREIKLLKLYVSEIRYDYFFQYGHIPNYIKAKIAFLIGSFDIF